MKPTRCRHEQPPEDNRGVALVLTLLVVAMLTVVVVSFNAMTRTEQAAARNYTKYGVGMRIAQAGESRAIQLLQTVLTNTNGPLVTQPGRALYWDSAGNMQTVQLSSAAAGGGAGSANLNVGARSPTDASIIWNSISTNTGNASYFSAPLIDVYDSAGQIQGRYAFWIDDNGSRLNLNYAVTNIRSVFYPTNRRPLDAMAMRFGTNATTENTNRSIFTNRDRGFAAALNHSGAPTMTTNINSHTPTWGYFFLPEQIRSFGATNRANNADRNRAAAQSLFNALQWQVAAGPGNLTNTNEAPASLGRQPLVPGFLGSSASEAVVDGFIGAQVDSPQVLTRFGGQSFAGKYTFNALRQILANINDFPLGSTGVSFGAELLDAQEGVPRSFAALRPYPHLNEVAVRPYYAVAADGGQIEVQVYLGVELINPYPASLGAGARLYFDLQRFDFAGTYERDGVTNNISGGTNPWPRTGIFLATPVVVSNNIDPKSYAADRFFYRWEWQVNTPPPATNPTSTAISNINIAVNLQLRTVQLGQSTNPISIRDWACITDLPEWTFTVGSSQPTTTNVWVGPGKTGPIPSLGNLTVSDALARGVAKNDPRVRTFPGWQNEPNVSAWQAVGGGGPAITLGGNNSVVNFQSGTGTASGLPNDDAPEGNDVFAHPSFGAVDRSLPTSWRSAFELGQVHTGLQWRTLHMHSQKANEPGLVPDWALLDLFAVTNAYVPVTTRLNVNSLPFPAMQQGLQAANAASQGLARSGSYSALIGGFISGNTPQNAQILLAGQLTNAGLISAPGASFTTNDARTIGTNLATLNFTRTNGWATRRLGLPGFPVGALGSLAEVVEVAGVSDGAGLTKAEKEQRGRVLYESLSTYSDTFTIYSVGQALEQLPSGQLDVLGEVFTRTQVRFDPVTGRIIPVVRTPVLPPDSL